MKIKSFGKINLNLKVLDEEINGLHKIESLIIPIDFHDVIEIEEIDNDKDIITFDSTDIPDNNTVSKTLDLIRETNDFSKYFEINIIKNIPTESGLGGGSSNAGTIISKLSQTYDLSIPSNKDVVEKIGSDVPFFITGKPAFVKGVGDIIEPKTIDFEMNMLLVVPKETISTGDAFSEFDRHGNTSTILDIYNGIELFGSRNYNFGKSLSSNHNVRYAMKFFNRKVVVEPDSLDVFSNAIPESGKEGSISLTYTFTNKRPNINNMYVPRNGFGIQLEGDLIDKNIWGDFSYKHYNIDAYINKGLGPATLYLRGRYEKISGQPPAQETAELVDIPTNYYAGQFVLGKEHMSPRGWEGANLGDRAFMGTAEIRSPLIDLSLFEILKIVKAGKLSFSCIECHNLLNNLFEKKIKNIIICGIETHICILQSALDLYKLGFNIHVISDAVESRNEDDKRVALKRLVHSDITISTTEMAIFEICRTSKRSEFKEISAIIKKKNKI